MGLRGRQLTSVAGLLVLAALAGYLIGHRPGAVAPTYGAATLSRSTTDAGISLQYPATWQRVDLPPDSQTLGDLQQPLVLLPRGHGAEAGLVVGLLKEPTRGPLPSALLARTSGDPHAEVVLTEAGIQVYRYSRLGLSGSPLSLTAYSFPPMGGRAVVVLCYATAAASRARQECEQIAERLTPPDSGASELTPSGHLVGLLRATLPVLSRQRAAIRAQMHSAKANSSLASLATRMADAFAAARGTLTPRPLQTAPLPGSYGKAEIALIGSLSAVEKAYRRFAAVAAHRPFAGDASARKALSTSEARLQNALNGLALLGY